MHTGKTIYEHKVLWESLQVNYSLDYSPDHRSTLGRNSTNAMTEKKPSVGTLSSQCLCEYPQERNTVTIMNSENSLKEILFNLTEYMRTSWLGNIWMQWLWISYQKSLIPWGKSDHTEKRNFLCVMNVRKASMIPFTFIEIQESTLERNLLNIYNVGKPSAPKYPVLHNRINTKRV